jgi:hypothetical protein
MNKGNKPENDSQSASADLKDIKSLLILLRVKTGASQAEIERALGINQATVSRQFRFGTVKPLRATVNAYDEGE